MKKFSFLMWGSAAAILLLFSSYKERESDKNETIMQVMMEGLKVIHYQPEEVDDHFSEKVFDLYLKRSDFNKKFFLKEDIDRFSKYKDQLDDEVRAANYEFFNTSMEVLNSRITEAQGYYKDILTRPFDFKSDENVELEGKKLSYAADKNALKEEWRKYLKYQTLLRLAETMETQDKLKEKNDTAYQEKSMEKMEADARKRVLKSEDDYFGRLTRLEDHDRLSIYLNCIANTFDPHTEYFEPRAKEDFDIQMSGQLEGIGATLEERDGNIKVTSIVAGSPAWKKGELKAGDIIQKVAQGSGEPVDIVGMRLNNAITLIRGKKGTEVRLTIKKPDASIKQISIIRDVIIIEDTYAQSAIVNDGKEKIGYIKLPVFYADFNNKGGRNCADDIKKELQKLKAENVDGVVLDLRNNGGGSLEDVVRMAGLFVDKGPMVQVKSRMGAPLLMEDTDPSVVYGGPLVVMVNSLSASASEIMAAAMQDYKRGVIMGSNATFGKGTVQRFFNLDDYVNTQMNDIKPLGSMKMTTQKFYRINGGATQLKGVIPDIVVPDPYSYVDISEKEEDYPMKWDEITPAKYKTWTPAIDYDKVIKDSKSRVKNSKEFNLITEESEKFKKQKDKTYVSLNLEKYRTEQKKIKEEDKKYEAITKENTGLQVFNTKADQEVIQKDSSKVARNTEWFKNIRKDIYIAEAAKVVGDIKR